MPGGQDLTPAQVCTGFAGVTCRGTRDSGQQAGANLAWRQAFSHMPAPWGDGAPAHSGSLEFRPVDGPAGANEAPGGGAHTHYALDVFDTAKQQALVRLVFADTSLRSASGASDAVQNPQDSGGQSAWLQAVLCIKGSATDTAQLPCTRAPSERAVVVSNSPTFFLRPRCDRSDPGRGHERL